MSRLEMPHLGRRGALLGILAATFAASPAFAQAPGVIDQQGRFLKMDGAPETAALTVTYALYDASAGGMPLWSESVMITPDAGGFYSLRLGSITPFPKPLWDGRTLYLGITIMGEMEMAPRQPIVSLPYALRAGVAQNATGDITPNSLSVNGKVVIDKDGQITANGKLIVGRDGNLVNAQGPKGEIGLKGPTGDAGPKGDPGVKGDTGDKGEVGMAGTNGAPGSPGAAGPKGPKGDTGDKGPVGASSENGCPGPRIQGVCVLQDKNGNTAHSNQQMTNFQQAAQICAFQGGDLCTDSQAWGLTVGYWQNNYLSTSLMWNAHWTAQFGDNDAGNWSGSNGGTGDDHGPNSSYGYVCCGGYTPPNARVDVKTVNSVKVNAIHNQADTYWPGAVAYCASLNADICSDAQTLLLRDGGVLTVQTWTNSHADNDAGRYNAINGGTSDDTHPSHLYGFACCPSLRPADLSCPVNRISGVCAVEVNNVANADFRTAAKACAGKGADLCSTAQSAVLRTAGNLTVPVWSNSHSDNDASNASVGVGPMPDNPDLSMAAGYACCLN